VPKQLPDTENNVTGGTYAPVSNLLVVADKAQAESGDQYVLQHAGLQIELT
jgi:hypothetical protein